MINKCGGTWNDFFFNVIILGKTISNSQILPLDSDLLTVSVLLFKIALILWAAKAH